MRFDHQLELAGPLDGQLAGVCARKNATDVARGLPGWSWGRDVGAGFGGAAGSVTSVFLIATADRKLVPLQGLILDGVNEVGAVINEKLEPVTTEPVVDPVGQ